MFISFEGIDGVGKSTQIRLAEEYLRGLGRDVLTTFEPGGTELGQEIRNLLLHRKGDVAPRSEALLYAADRAHHVATKIRPALADGKIVITDRYLDSSVAYQGAGRKLSAEEVRNTSVWAVDGLLPDLTILLDLDAAKAAERRETTGQEADRLEREKLDFFEAVRSEFLKLAAAEPNRFLVVDAEQTPEEIFEKILAKLNELLSK
ncbi:MAG: dTMP kinase [Actinobacteria bacterium]|uniref:dTMP kinase n=1 Tax=freshwater metagenome TaxID=449393 RepID=A0A6J6GPS3_9ZZZZ|nr:dTMP kinase [Actinomycetota bacterium]